MMISGYAMGMQGLFYHKYNEPKTGLTLVAVNESQVKDKTSSNVRYETSREARCFFNESPEQSFTGSGKESTDAILRSGPARG